jgi:hypothetical protein
MKNEMFNRALACLAAICLLLIAGCKEERSLPVAMIDSGAYSGRYDAGFEIISDQGELERVLDDLSTQASLELGLYSIDFESQMIVAVFMGEKSTAGYVVGFEENARLKGDMLEIEVFIVTPPPDAFVAQVVTRPYAIAAIDRGDYNHIAFVDSKSGEVLEKF